MFATIGYIVLACVIGGLAADAVHSYVTGTGNVWQRLLAVGKGSATILTARVGAIGGFALDGIVQVSNVIASPGVKGFIDQYLNGKVVGYTMIACALVIEIARRRSLDVPVVGKDA